MGWFERQASGRDRRQVQQDHARLLRASGLDRALLDLSGPHGLRRFLLFFEHRGSRVVVTGMDAQPLQWGGGPPPVDADGRGVAAVERALSQLHKHMAGAAPWSAGAVGLIRTATGESRLFTWFDDDLPLAGLDRLPLPGPPGHPLESHEYRGMLARWEAAMVAVQRTTLARSGDWGDWSIDAGQLRLEVGQAGQPGHELRRHRVVVLGTWLPEWDRFAWQVDEPLFDEEVFRTTPFGCDLGAAVELALLTAARLGAAWLFSGGIERPEGTLFAAVRE